MEYTSMEQYWIWLSSVEGMTGRKFYQMLAEYGDAREVWENIGPGMKILGARAYKSLLEARDERYFYALFDRLQRLGITVVTRLSDDYPGALTLIADPPPTLYVRGDTQLNIDNAIAIVGSRKSTRDGQRAALEIAQGLAEHGVTVVSGMARGIDGFAHIGCMNGSGHTVAVLGCGVDVVYPPEHDDLACRILDSGGSIISEYGPGTPPLAQHFPQRNRIISGMSKGVLLVEGGERSGAMITANYALDQGKDVFVVPGSIYAPLSIAPNRLMVDGAAPVLSKWEILEYYHWADRSEESHVPLAPVELSEDEARILDAAQNEYVPFQTLLHVTNFDTPKLNSLLTMLELRGIIEQSPGRYYRARVSMGRVRTN